jgi:hypothetical protein
MSVQECQRKVSSSEFVEWCVVLDEEWNEHSKQDYYLAQISHAIWTFIYARADQKKSLKLSDCLMEFEFPKSKPVETVEDKKKRIAEEHKAAMFAAFGLNSEGKQIFKFEDGKMVRR